MRYFVVFVFVVVYAFWGKELGYTSSFPVWKHLTFHFQHGSVFHLLMNSLSFFSLSGALCKMYASRKWLVCVLPIAVGTFASFLVSYDMPVVGASGVVYAQLGMWLVYVYRHRSRLIDRRKLYVPFLSIGTFLVVGLVKENVAGLLHLYCLIGGVVATFISSASSASATALTTVGKYK